MLAPRSTRFGLKSEIKIQTKRKLVDKCIRNCVKILQESQGIACSNGNNKKGAVSINQ